MPTTTGSCKTVYQLIGFIAVIGVIDSWASSAEGQMQVAERVDALFSEWDTPTSPGCALGVLHLGELVYARGYGAADLETQRPITPESIFYLGSVSKQFTAASVALLAERGQLSVGDDIRDYLPELGASDPPITVRHLIHHMSGIRDYYALLGLAGRSWQDSDARETFDLIVHQEGLNFDPGDQYLYSNSGYFLLPIVVQRVTGRSIREFAQQHFFGPLEMTRTSFHDDHTVPVPDRVYSYGVDDTGAYELTFLPEFDLVGAGGVLSNIRDLAKWDQNFYDRDVGGSALFDRLHTRGVLNNGDTLTYAYGLRVDEYKGLRIVAHSGSLMGFRTALTRFPDQQFSVICLCNLETIDPAPLALRVADIYLGHELETSLAEYSGQYFAAELEVTWNVTVEGPDLIFAWADNRQVSRADGADRFRLDGARVQFLRDGRGTITGFEIDAGRARGVHFVRKRQ